MAYNGWTNRQTWNTELWWSNDEPTYRHKMDLIDGVDEDEAISSEFVRRHTLEVFPNGTPDMESAACFGGVNWQEIADGWEEERA